MGTGTTFANAGPAVTSTFEAAVQGTVERNAFWGLAQQFSPASNYPRTHTWLEGHVKPGLKARLDLGQAAALYSGVSVLLSGTAGDDVFEQGDTGRALVEEAYLGWRGRLGDSARLDVSAGSQNYRLGHGFLLANGAGNGFERGSATTSPRRAWAMTALAQISDGPWTAEAFYLDANELKSGDTGTRLHGLRGEWASSPDASWGLAWFKVGASTAPYPQAPLQIIDAGRDGLETTDLIWRYEPQGGALAGLSLLGEAASQRYPRINLRANGLGAEVGYRAARLPFAPRFSWSLRRFSGDDPATPGTLERFDPLFYDGAPATWSSGGNGSFAFYNSNLVVHRWRVDLALSQRDFLNVNVWRIDAAELNSPIQYGQGARLTISGGAPAIVAGVPSSGLTNELYIEYTRVISANAFATFGLANAIPRGGLKALVPDARNWWGGLVNVNWRY